MRKECLQGKLGYDPFCSIASVQALAKKQVLGKNWLNPHSEVRKSGSHNILNVCFTAPSSFLTLTAL